MPATNPCPPCTSPDYWGICQPVPPGTVKGCDGNGGSGGGDHDWYVREIQSKPDQYDTGISEAQWIAWRPFWDEASKSFRNENVDSSGNPITGSGFNKPVDCPGGTTKFYQNQCLPLSDWRVAGGGGTGTGSGASSSAGGAKAATASAPAPPDYSQLPYGKSDLRNALADMFNYRAGIFGTKDPHLSGATSRAPKDQDIAGYFLPEGGVWWGGKGDLASALAGFNLTIPKSTMAATSVPTTGRRAAKPTTTLTSGAFTVGPGSSPNTVQAPPGGTPLIPGQPAGPCPPGFHWNGASCVANTSTSSAVGPLSSALGPLFGGTTFKLK